MIVTKAKRIAFLILSIHFFQQLRNCSNRAITLKRGQLKNHVFVSTICFYSTKIKDGRTKKNLRDRRCSSVDLFNQYRKIYTDWKKKLMLRALIIFFNHMVWEGDQRDATHLDHWHWRPSVKLETWFKVQGNIVGPNIEEMYCFILHLSMLSRLGS